MRRVPAPQRLVLVIGAIVFVDTMFYAVLAPLLPGLAHQLRLSKLSAGVMTASYPLGTLIGSLPGGLLAARAGPRFTVRLGLALLACSTVAFAVLHSAPALDVARFIEGAGGACSWAGGLAWIIAETPANRRGEMIGRALAAAIGGSLFGPVIGTIATATGRAAAFSGVAVVSILLIFATSSLPHRHVRSVQGLRETLAVTRERGVRSAMWLVALPALAAGMISVLGPLRLHHFGASAVAVGAVYLVASALEAAVSPAVGRVSDRRGRLVPVRFGLGAAAVVLACFTLPQDTFLLAVVIVALAAALGAFWTPAMAMLSDAADAHGLNQGLAAALVNVAWSGGQIGGSGVGGAIAKSAGDAVPAIAVAVLCLATLAWLRPQSTRSPLPAGEPEVS
jgi:predicted MFS family arabinose efflux permease